MYNEEKAAFNMFLPMQATRRRKNGRYVHSGSIRSAFTFLIIINTFEFNVQAVRLNNIYRFQFKQKPNCMQLYHNNI